MEQMYICPKAKECKLDCYSSSPHDKNDACYRDIGGTCPTCVPYEPEPYVQVCPMCEQDLPIGSPVLEVEEPEQGQLVWMSPRETITKPICIVPSINITLDEIRINKYYDGFMAGINTVYSTIKPVNIDGLAEYIAVNIFDVEAYPDIKQAITQYIKELK
jgi:hypothetical protein